MSVMDAICALIRRAEGGTLRLKSLPIQDFERAEGTERWRRNA